MVCRPIRIWSKIQRKLVAAEEKGYQKKGMDFFHYGKNFCKHFLLVFTVKLLEFMIEKENVKN
jgi:hypothetical protein